MQEKVAFLIVTPEVVLLESEQGEDSGSELIVEFE